MFVLISIIHISTGAFAVLLGAVASFTRKGGRVHIPTGRAFVLLMTISSLLGASLGLIYFDAFFITFFAGILAVYLVLSGWAAARSTMKGQRKFILVFALLNAANVLALTVLGASALGSVSGQMFGFAGEDYLFLAGMAGIGLVSDTSLIFRSGLSQKHRIARHLWRMLLGFFIAAGSAFTGPGAAAFPDAVQQSGLLALPELIILLLMVFYLVKTLCFSKGTSNKSDKSGQGNEQNRI